MCRGFLVLAVIWGLFFQTGVRASGEGYSLYTNGSVVELPTFSFGASPWTWEAWLQPRQVNDFHFSTDVDVWAWGSGKTSTDSLSLRLRRADGKLAVSVRNKGSVASTVVSNRAVPLRIWTHVAIVFYNETADGETETRIFFDGVLRDKFPGTLPIPTKKTRDSHSLAKGVMPSPPGTPFDGLLDDFRLWSVARSDADIADSYLDGVAEGDTEGLELSLEFETFESMTQGQFLSEGGTGGSGTLKDSSPQKRKGAVLKCLLPDPRTCRAQFGSGWSKIRCGDSKRSGSEECDDGNLEDGDGCSADCEVEDGWMCLAGAPGATDECLRGEVVQEIGFEPGESTTWATQLGAREDWVVNVTSKATDDVDGGVWELDAKFRADGEQGLRLWQRKMVQTGEDYLPDLKHLAMWFRADKGATKLTEGKNKVVTAWKDQSGSECVLEGAPKAANGMILSKDERSGQASLKHDIERRGYVAHATKCPKVVAPFTVFTFTRYPVITGSRLITSADWDYRIGLTGYRVGWYDSRRRGWVEHRTSRTGYHYYTYRPQANTWYLISAVGKTSEAVLYRDSALVARESGMAGDVGRLAISGGGRYWEIGSTELTELIVYNTSISDMDRMKVEQYLVDRYQHHSAPGMLMAKQLMEDSPSDYVTQGAALLSASLQDPNDRVTGAKREQLFVEWMVRIESDPQVFGVPLVVMFLEEPSSGWGAAGVPAVTKCGPRSEVGDPWLRYSPAVCAGMRYYSICYGGGGSDAVPCDETRDAVRLHEWTRQSLDIESAFAQKYSDARSLEDEADLSFADDGGVPETVRMVLAQVASPTEDTEAWVDEVRVIRRDHLSTCDSIKVRATPLLSVETVAMKDEPVAHYRLGGSSVSSAVTDVVNGRFTTWSARDDGTGSGVTTGVDSLVHPNDPDTAVSLNPTSEYLNFPFGSGRPKSDTEEGFAIEVRVKMPGLPSKTVDSDWGGVVLMSDRDPDSTSSFGFIVSVINTGHLRVQLRTDKGTSILRTNDAIFDALPSPSTHLILSYDASLGEISMFVDGLNRTMSLESSSSYMTPNTGVLLGTTNDVRLGYDGVGGGGGGSLSADVTFDELIIYPKPLSSAQALAHAFAISPSWTAGSEDGGEATATFGDSAASAMLSSSETGLAVWVMDPSDPSTVIHKKKFDVFSTTYATAKAAVQEAAEWIKDEANIPIGHLVAVAVRPGTEDPIAWKKDYRTFPALHHPPESNYLFPPSGLYGLESMSSTQYVQRGFPRTYSGAKDYCESNGRVLCNFEAYCDKLRNNIHLRGYNSYWGRPTGDHWAPYDAHNGTTNTWVYVGRAYSEQNCETHMQVHSSWPSWGDSTGHDPAGGMVLCCSRANQMHPWKTWQRRDTSVGNIYHDDAHWRTITYGVRSDSWYFQTRQGSYWSTSTTSHTRCTEHVYGMYYYLDDPYAMEWTDYTIELRMYTYVRDKGILFRFQDPDNYYRFYFNTDAGVRCHSFLKIKDGEWTRGKLIWGDSDGSMTAKHNAWIDVKIEVYGNTFTAYYDGKKAMEWTDDSGDPITAGSFGFWTAYAYNVHFTNVRVYENKRVDTSELDETLALVGAPPLPLPHDLRRGMGSVAVLGRRRTKELPIAMGNATVSVEEEFGERYPAGVGMAAWSGHDGDTQDPSVSTVFECPVQTVRIPENTPVGTATGLPVLTRAGTLPAWQSIVGGNVVNEGVGGAETATLGAFSLDRAGGRLQLARDVLDFEDQSEFNITVAAEGGPRSFDSGWFPMHSMTDDPDDSFREVRIPHELATYDPASLRVDVSVRVPEGPNRGYSFKANGAAAVWMDNVYEWVKYGGLLSAYSSGHRLNASTAEDDTEKTRAEGLVRLWAPTHWRFGVGSIIKIGAGAGATWDPKDPTIFTGEAYQQLSHRAEVRVRVRPESPPHFDSGWIPIESNRRYSSQRDIEHYFGGFPERARVLVRAVAGPLAGFVHEARGDGMKQDSYSRYGGVVFGMTATKIRVWLASRYGGGSTEAYGVNVPLGYGNDNYTTGEYPVEIRVQAWRLGGLRAPDWDTGWGEKALEFLRGGNAFAEVDISEGTDGVMPSKVEVWVRGRSGEDIIVPSVGMPSSTSWVDWMGVGGIYAAHTADKMRLWTPSADESRPTFPSSGHSPMFTYNGWGGSSTAINSAVASVRIRIWRDAADVPADVTDMRVQLINLEEAPSVADSSVQVPEYSTIGLTKTRNGTKVGSVSATDEDSASSLNFELLEGNRKGIFELDTDTGEISVGKAELLSYEDQGVYDLVVAVDDGIFRTISTTRVEVGDANDPCSIFPANFTMAENPDPNQIVGTPIESEDPDEEQTLLYSIVGGNIGNAFAINKCSGQIRVETPKAVNYEVTPVFHLRVMVQDDGIPSTNATTDVFIFLTDVNDPPQFDTAEMIAWENALVGDFVANIPLVDEDNDTLYVQVSAGDSSGYFEVYVNGLNETTGHPIYALRMSDKVVSTGDGSGRNGDPGLVLDYEDTQRPSRRFSLRLIAFDRDETKLLERLTAIAFFNVDVGDRNDLPFFQQQSISVLESTEDGEVAGSTLQSTDEDSYSLPNHAPRSDKHTFTIQPQYAAWVASNVPFSLDPDGFFEVDLGATGMSELDHETEPFYIVPVRCTDSGGDNGEGGAPRYVDANVTINIANVNEAPSIEDANFDVDENVPPGTFVGRVNAWDPDRADNLTFTIDEGDPQGVFGIDISGNITVAKEGGVDYESTPSYTLLVTVADAAGINDTATVQITVNDMNDPPSWTPSCTSDVPNKFRQYPGRSTVQGLLYSPTAADGQSVFVLSGGESRDACEEACDASANCAAYSYYTSAYELSDWRSTCLGRTAFKTTNIELEEDVTDADATVFAGIKVTVCRAVSLTENTAGGSTLIGSGSPLLVKDFEGDGFTVTLTDYPDMGRDDLEDGSESFEVVDLSSTDSNGYSEFGIDLQAGAEINFESTPFFVLELVAEDDGDETPSSRIVIAVDVTDVDEAPSFDEGSSIDRSVAELDPKGTLAGFAVSCSDDDTAHGDNILYTLDASGNEAGYFGLVNTTGQLYLLKDMEDVAPQTYTLTMTCEDEGGQSDSTTVTVTLQDTNTRPAITGVSTERTVTENSGSGTLLGDALGVNDPDVGDSHTWSIVSISPQRNPQKPVSYVSIDGSGQLSLAEDVPTIVNYECHRTRPLDDCPDSHREIVVRVAVTDDGDGTLSQFADVTISVVDEEEASIVPSDTVEMEVYELTKEGSPLSFAPALSGALFGLQPRVPDFYDDDKNPLTFTIVSGDPNGYFSARASNASVFAGDGGGSAGVNDEETQRLIDIQFPPYQLPELVVTEAGEQVLDYETLPEIDLVLSVDDGSSLPAQEVDVHITIVDVRERPVLDSDGVEHVTIVEGAPASTLVFNLSSIASDPDGDTLRYVVDEVIRENPAGANSTEEPDEISGLLVETFSMDASEGVLRTRASASGDSVLDFETVARYFITLRAADRPSDLDPEQLDATIVVVLNVVDVNDMVIHSVEPASGEPLATPGNEAVILRGENLGYQIGRAEGQPSVSAAYGCVVKETGEELPRPVTVGEDPFNSTCEYVATLCKFIAPFGSTVQCTSAEGAGSGHTWKLIIDGNVRHTDLALDSPEVPQTTRYASPVITEVEIQSGTSGSNVGGMETSGGDLIILHGRNFGPAVSGVGKETLAMYYEVATTITGIPRRRYWATNCEVLRHSRAQCTSVQGAGHSYWAVVGVREQYSPTVPVYNSLRQDALSAGDASETFPRPATSLLISYVNPTISALRGYELATGIRFNLDAMPTAGVGAGVVEIAGSNFGPVPGSVLPGPEDDRAAVLAAGGVHPFDRVFAHSSNSFLNLTVECSRISGHTLLLCPAPEGAGTNLRWSVEVGELESSKALRTTSYRPPVITSVAGPGARASPTRGDARILIAGTDLGPLTSDVDAEPFSLVQLQYGRPGIDLTWIQSSSCRAIRPHVEIECLSEEGTGAGHSAALVVAGQASNVISEAISYGPPYVARVDGEASPRARTEGGQEVIFHGSNLGATVDTLETVSYGPDGVEFRAHSCEMLEPHESISCLTDDGAGRGLKVRVIVDGLVSASPTTAYQEPTIDSISPAPRVEGWSTRGGEKLTINGEDFGPTVGGSYVDSVAYGPFVLPAAACNATVEHLKMECRTLAGVGESHALTLTVAGQPMAGAAPTISYAPPVIVAALQTRRRDPTVVTINRLPFDRLAAEIPTEGGAIRIVGFDVGSPSFNTSVLVAQPVSITRSTVVPQSTTALQPVSYEFTSCDATTLRTLDRIFANDELPSTSFGSSITLPTTSPSNTPTAIATSMDDPLDAAALGRWYVNLTSIELAAPSAAPLLDTSKLIGTPYEPACLDVAMPPGDGRGWELSLVAGERSVPRKLAVSYSDPAATALIVQEDTFLPVGVSPTELPDTPETRVIIFKGANFALDGIIVVAAGNGSQAWTAEEVAMQWDIQGWKDPLESDIAAEEGIDLDDGSVRSVDDFSVRVFACLSQAEASRSRWATVGASSRGLYVRGRDDNTTFTHTHTEVRCLLPPYVHNVPIQRGTAVMIVGSQQRTSEAWPFEENDPVIEEFSPQRSPTKGGGELEIVGRNLGSLATSASLGVKIDGNPCEIVDGSYQELIDLPEGGECPVGNDVGRCTPRSQQRARLSCVIPPGQSSEVELYAERFGRRGPAVTFSYDRPAISSLTGKPTQAQGGWPTQGGINATLRGSNFGPNPAVLVRGVSVPTYLVDQTSHRELLFTIPEGRGTGIDVVVAHSSLEADRSLATTFDYGQPFVDPSKSSPAGMRGATVGGTTIILRGRNFGSNDDGNAAVLLNGVAMTTTSWSHDEVSFVMPAGQGRDLSMVVVVAGQRSDAPYVSDGSDGGISGIETEPPAIEFSYLPPRLDSVSPLTAPTSGNHSVTNEPVLIVVTGANFGVEKSVMLGGVELDIVEGATSHERIVARVPPGQGVAELGVFAGGQTFPRLPEFVYQKHSVSGVVVEDPRTDACGELESVSEWSKRTARLPNGADSRRLCCDPKRVYVYGSSFGIRTPSVVLGKPETLDDHLFDLIGETHVNRMCSDIEAEILETWGEADEAEIGFSRGCFPRDPCIESFDHSSIVLRSVGGEGGGIEMRVHVDEVYNWQPTGEDVNVTVAGALSFSKPQMSIALPQPFNPIGEILEIQGSQFGFHEAIFIAEEARLAASNTNKRLLEARELQSAPTTSRKGVPEVSTGDGQVDRAVRERLPDTGDPAFGFYLRGRKYELGYRVQVDNVDCERARWVMPEASEDGSRAGRPYLLCFTGRIHVGFVNVSITIAGQEHLYDAELETLYGVCRKGWYGQFEEYCLQCPVGADCPGELVEPYAEPRFWREEIPKSDPFHKNDDVCHPDRRHRDTCPFFSVCVPDTACIGNNTCAEGYTAERCSECIRGEYYRVAGDCVKCPQNPEVILAFFTVGVMCVICSAYFFNKLKVNVGFVSIGLDYLQVLAIFARSKVAWPPGLLAFFQFLAVFNLNIDIAAPDCIVPDLDFRVRWFATILLPFAVLFVIALIHMCKSTYDRCIKGQRARDLGAQRSANTDALVTTVVTVAYIIYLLIARTCFEVFACNPTEPPDPRGRVYMESTAVPCYEEGGLHLQLLPWAIGVLLVYVIGFPILIALFLWRNRYRVEMDQFMRAKGFEWSPVDDQAMFAFRARYHRLYYFFVPQRFYWIVIIFLRKALFAATSLVFRANPAFQLAVSLLVVFFSFAAQIGYRPYYCEGERERVLEDIPSHYALQIQKYEERIAQQEANAADALWRARDVHRKRAVGVAKAVKERKRREMLMKETRTINFNTLEAVLLASAVLVNLSGLLFESERYANSGNNNVERDFVTYLVIFIITISLIYLFSAGIISIMSDIRPGFFRKPEGKREKLLRQAKKALKEKKSKSPASMENPLLKGSKKTKEGGSGETGSDDDEVDTEVDGTLLSDGDVGSDSGSGSGSGTGSATGTSDKSGMVTNPFLLRQRQKEVERQLELRDRDLDEEELESTQLPKDPPPRWLLKKYEAHLTKMSSELRDLNSKDAKLASDARIAALDGPSLPSALRSVRGFGAARTISKKLRKKKSSSKRLLGAGTDSPSSTLSNASSPTASSPLALDESGGFSFASPLRPSPTKAEKEEEEVERTKLVAHEKGVDGEEKEEDGSGGEVVKEKVDERTDVEDVEDEEGEEEEVVEVKESSDLSAPPSEDEEEEEGDGGDGGDEEVEEEKGAEDDDELPEGWVSRTDEDGDVYYINKEKGISTWDRPTE